MPSPANLQAHVNTFRRKPRDHGVHRTRAHRSRQGTALSRRVRPLYGFSALDLPQAAAPR